MNFKIRFLFPPEEGLDKELESRMKISTCYGVIETRNWREIFLMTHNIARRFKTLEKIIEKINYTLCHELIHGLLEYGNEVDVYGLTHALLEPFLKETKDFYSPKLRELGKLIVPVIDFSSPSFSESHALKRASKSWLSPEGQLQVENQEKGGMEVNKVMEECK